jgi:hypothetical protein
MEGIPDPSRNEPTTIAQFLHLGWLKIKIDWPMFVATLVLAIATIGLWLATRDLVKDAKHTAEQQLRAYVFLRDVRLQKRNDDSYDVIPEWENSGATETVGMTAHLNRLLSETPLLEWFSDGDVGNYDTVPIILGPKSTSTISFYSKNVPYPVQ